MKPLEVTVRRTWSIRIDLEQYFTRHFSLADLPGYAFTTEEEGEVGYYRPLTFIATEISEDPDCFTTHQKPGVVIYDGIDDDIEDNYTASDLDELYERFPWLLEPDDLDQTGGPRAWLERLKSDPEVLATLPPPSAWDNFVLDKVASEEGQLPPTAPMGTSASDDPVPRQLAPRGAGASVRLLVSGWLERLSRFIAPSK